MDERNIQKVSNAINLHLSFSREVQSLKRDGYCVLFNSQTGSSNVIKMKHLSNGRTLVLILTRQYWLIRDNRRIIKMVRPIRVVN